MNSSTPKISVITASFRPERLEAVRLSLAAQSVREFEWLICGPVDPIAHDGMDVRYFPEPAKRHYNLYNLTKAWNLLCREARGELLVFWCDSTWSGPNALFHLWNNYVENPRSVVGGVGIQFQEDRPGARMVTAVDPRLPKIGTQIDPMDIEFRLASVPRDGFTEAGGFDESFDCVAAWHDKEFVYRLAALGYSVFLDGNAFYWNEVHASHAAEAGRANWDVLATAGLLLLNARVQHANPCIIVRDGPVTYELRPDQNTYTIYDEADCLKGAMRITSTEAQTAIANDPRMHTVLLSIAAARHGHQIFEGFYRHLAQSRHVHLAKIANQQLSIAV